MGSVGSAGHCVGAGVQGQKQQSALAQGFPAQRGTGGFASQFEKVLNFQLGRCPGGTLKDSRQLCKPTEISGLSKDPL